MFLLMSVILSTEVYAMLWCSRRRHTLFTAPPPPNRGKSEEIYKMKTSITFVEFIKLIMYHFPEATRMYLDI